MKSKKQHFISQGILNQFFSTNKVKEAILKNKSIVTTKIGDTMEINLLYELPEYEENALEIFFANNFDNTMKNLIEEILRNIESYEKTYQIVSNNINNFIIAYYKSLAYINENTMDLSAYKDDHGVRTMIKNIFDKQYIEKLSKTIINGYKSCIIKSDKAFVLSDQYIATVSTDVKNKFADLSNRSIGLKNTMLLIPISSSYYIIFYNGIVPAFLEEGRIVSLKEDEILEINSVIFNNSYIKVSGEHEEILKKLLEGYDDNKSRTQCIIGMNNGKSIFFNNKKEVFLYKKDEEIYNIYADPITLSKYLFMKRNDMCACGNSKKYKKCCIEKGEKCKEMYKDIKMYLIDKYRISNELIVERNI